MRRVFWVSLLVVFAHAVRADVAFTTLGPGGTYDSSAAGIEVNGLNASGPQSAANEFQPTIDGLLQSISVGITNYDSTEGGSGAVVLHLYANNVNMPATAVDLATGPLTATAASGSTNSALTTFTYAGPPLLLSHNLSYWLVLAPGSQSTTVNWQQSFPTIAGSVGTSGNGTSFNVRDGTLDAFEVDVQAVPEPASSALVVVSGTLMIGIALVRRYARSEI